MGMKSKYPSSLTYQRAKKEYEKLADKVKDIRSHYSGMFQFSVKKRDIHLTKEDRGALYSCKRNLSSLVKVKIKGDIARGKRIDTFESGEPFYDLYFNIIGLKTEVELDLIPNAFIGRVTKSRISAEDEFG